MTKFFFVYLTVFLGYCSLVIGQDLSTYELLIEEEEFQSLMEDRTKAMTLDLLIEDFREVVPALLKVGKAMYAVEIRLKGDLYDHWADTTQMSFRVSLLNGKTINGRKQFSIQHPKRRKYLDDWVFNKVLEYHGLIHTEYEFVQFKLNGQKMGLYAVEEFSDKYFLEKNQRREGPLFRVNDNLFWRHNILEAKGAGLENMAALTVKPFGTNRLLKNENMAKQYTVGSQLLYGFERRYFDTHEVFELEALAKSFVLTADVFGEDHALRIPNLRYYYNPLSSKLEPIAFDCGGIKRLKKTLAEIYLASYEGFFEDPEKHPDWFRTFFRDSTFVDAYFEQFAVLSEREWMDDFWKSIDPEYQKLTALFKKEYPKYKVRKDVLFANLKSMQNKLLEVNKRDSLMQIAMEGKVYKVGHDWKRQGIQVAFKSYDSLKHQITLQIGNHSSFETSLEALKIDKNTLIPLENIWTGKAKENYHFVAHEDIIVDLPKTMIWTERLRNKMKAIYRYKNRKYTETTKVLAFPFYDAKTFEDDLFRSEKSFKNIKWLQVNEAEKIIQIGKGKWTLSQNILIDPNYTVNIAAGAKITLKNGANFMSYSPIIATGTESDPIVFTSKEGGGFLVMGTKERSILTHVHFEKLTNPKTTYWEPTGAVTFSESDVVLDYCIFKDNQSEDALNVVSSILKITNCTWENTFSDAFDADFCRGKVTNSTFLNCGNDGIDVSGSRVNIADIVLKDIADKAISAGERSKVNAKKITIERAHIGLASKDLSVLKVDDVTLTDSEIHATVYQKKESFGPATLQLLNCHFEKDDSLLKIEKRSILEWEGTKIKGDMLQLYKVLYPTMDLTKLERYIEQYPSAKRFERMRALQNN